MKAAYFIAGTDTGVGKTLVASALLHAFVRQGRSAVGMKPVAAGCVRVGARLCCEDVASLLAASSIVAPPELVNPYALVPPVAPHIAAAQAGQEIRLDCIEQAFHALAAMAEVVVVEGVGGFMVPLNEREDAADLAQRLDLPLILVVGLRLGCLNHALLTAEAVRRRGLKLAGWVANQINPAMAEMPGNLALLQNRLAAPLLGVLPYAPAALPEQAADRLAINLLD